MKVKRRVMAELRRPLCWLNTDKSVKKSGNDLADCDPIMPEPQ